MKPTIAQLLFLALWLTGCAPRPPSAAPDENRIVSLAPNLTEIICAVGADAALVGRTSACDYPPEIVKSVPVVGGFGAPSMDRLLKTRPTLVLDVALEDKTVTRLMTQLGIRRVRIPCATLADIPAAILAVGRLAHAEPAAEPLAERIRREVSRRRAAIEERSASGVTAPTVFAEIWGDPLMTVGRNSFVSELIRLAGGRNLGDEVTAKDYFPVSGEWVIARDPDIVLCLYMTERDGRQTTEDRRRTAANQQPGSTGALHRGESTISDQRSAISNQMAGRMGWAQIKAVREGRVYSGFDNNLILRPGPRVLEGIEALQACIRE